MKKVDVYTLGQFGVNRVKSPVHVRDGELLSAQNASIRLIQGQLAVTKRDGMAKINSVAAAGTLLSIGNIPLADPGYIFQGNNWISASSTPAIGCNDIAWSDPLGLFVAVGDHHASGSAMTSPDGINWTQRTINGATVGWFSVIWSETDQKFVAGGSAVLSASYIAWSTDGINWTTPTLPANANTRRVAYSPELDLYVFPPATGSTVRWYSSEDLVTYTNRDQTFAQNWNGIEWSPELGLFAAVRTNTVATSSDGITFTEDSSVPAGTWEDITWSPERRLFVAVASAGVNRVMTSADGVTWTARTPSETNAWRGVTNFNGRFVAVSSDGTNRVMVSTDGFNWVAQAAAAANSWNAVAISSDLDKGVAVSGTGAIRAMYSI